MDKKGQTRLCNRNRSDPASFTPRGSKQICIPMLQEQYNEIWHDAEQVRNVMDKLIEESPELFPSSISAGYRLTGRLPESKKLPGIQLRQVRIQEGVYSLRPSFVMSYMSGTVEELEDPLLLLSLGVPCWVVTHIFGHNDMFWQRHLERLGRNSLVGTTVPIAARLPIHLAADEHHADWCGEKGYAAFTAGAGCILGVALSSSADEAHLQEAYGVFAQEAQALDPKYSPETVNTDGWWATQKAFTALFSTIVPILCFLHGFLKIRDRCRKALDLHQQVWDVYRAETAQEFHQLMTDFRTGFEPASWPKSVSEMVAKLWNRTEQYALSYEHPGCHRTSNLVDRLMNRLTRFLYHGRGLHGHQPSSEFRLRGWALLNNFRPFAPRSGKVRDYHSPAHRLNQKQYHQHWLHNLQVCSSCQGRRALT
jgi:hypothetical protein